MIEMNMQKRKIIEKNEYLKKMIRAKNVFTKAKSMPVFFLFFQVNKLQTNKDNFL